MIKKLSFIITFTIFVLFFVSCTSYIAKQKKQEEAVRNLGEAYMSEGNYTFALRELLKAEKIYHNDPFLHNDLGETYMAKNKKDLAINHFRKAIKLKSDYAPAINNLGVAYMAKGDWDTAIDCFKKVSKNLLYVTPHNPLSNMGLAYYNKKEYKLAEQSYLEALNLQPEFIKALWGLGRTYIKLNRLPDAVRTLEAGAAAYEKAIAKLKKDEKPSPQSSIVYFELAEAYRRSHLYTNAVEVYDRIVELFPNSKQAREAKQKAEEI